MRTYNILTLGASGAGKTVFMASLFKQLSTQGGHGFFLKVDQEAQRRLLNLLYTQVATGCSWPAGTKYGEVSEWTFTCYVKTAHGTGAEYAACRFVYLDYAGGRLTDVTEDDHAFDFAAAISNADAVLGLLDGQKLQALMNGSDQRDITVWLTSELPNTLQLMYSCQAPIHFVISKWDLLEGKYSLGQIRDRLLEKVPEFRNLVACRNQAGLPVRLIPVSAVGLGFAALQSDGTMQKVPGATPHPLRVEVPLACVLPDGLAAQIQHLKNAERDLNRQSIDQKPVMTLGNGIELVLLPMLTRLAAFGRKRLSTASLPTLTNLLPHNYQFEPEVMIQLLDRLEARAQQKQTQLVNHAVETMQQITKLRQQRDNSLQSVKDETTALRHLVDSFALIEKQLDLEFPASNLGRLEL